MPRPQSIQQAHRLTGEHKGKPLRYSMGNGSFSVPFSGFFPLQKDKSFEKHYRILSGAAQEYIIELESVRTRKAVNLEKVERKVS